MSAPNLTPEQQADLMQQNATMREALELVLIELDNLGTGTPTMFDAEGKATPEANRKRHYMQGMIAKALGL